MNQHSWKLLVNNVLTYKGFVVRILRLNEAGDGVDKMEALQTEFLSQDKLFQLAALGFEKGLDGKYIYEVKINNDETQTT